MITSLKCNYQEDRNLVWPVAFWETFLCVNINIVYLPPFPIPLLPSFKLLIAHSLIIALLPIFLLFLFLIITFCHPFSGLSYQHRSKLLSGMPLIMIQVTLHSLTWISHCLDAYLSWQHLPLPLFLAFRNFLDVFQHISSSLIASLHRCFPV